MGSWSLISGLARSQFGVHVKNWHWANTVRNVRVEPYALQEDKIPRYINSLYAQIHDRAYRQRTL